MVVWQVGCEVGGWVGRQEGVWILGVGVEELSGNQSSGLECRAVIFNKFQVGFQDVVVKLQEDLQFADILLLDGAL